MPKKAADNEFKPSCGDPYGQGMNYSAGNGRASFFCSEERQKKLGCKEEDCPAKGRLHVLAVGGNDGISVSLHS